MRWLFGLLLLTTVFLTACRPEIEGTKKETYFSTDRYFTQLIDSLSGTTTTLVKRAIINAQTEVDTVVVHQDSIFWQREWQAFREADINKPALIGQYEVDTQLTTDTLFQAPVLEIRHTAQKNDLRTKELLVWLSPDTREVLGFYLRTTDQNVIYKSGQSLTFIRDEGYTIDAYQQVVTQGEETYRLESTWLAP